MIFDFASQVAGFSSGESVQLVRAGADTSAFGVTTPGSDVTTEIGATAVVIRGIKSQELLPAGERTGEGITLFTVQPLQTVTAPGGTRADRIIYQGETFEVRGVRSWVAHGNFYESVATRVGQ